MNQLLLDEFDRHHSYIQLVAQAHMTWFAFHFIANTTALGFYKNPKSPYLQYLRVFLVLGNLMGGIGSRITSQPSIALTDC